MNGPWHYDQAEQHRVLAWLPGTSDEETANRMASANFHARMAQTAALLEVAEIHTELLNHLTSGQYLSPGKQLGWKGVLRRTQVTCGHWFREPAQRCALGLGHAGPHEREESED